MPDHDQAWGSAVILFALALFIGLFVAGALKARRVEAAADQRDYDALRPSWRPTEPMALGEEIAADYGYSEDPTLRELRRQTAGGHTCIQPGDPWCKACKAAGFEPTPIYDQLDAEAVIASAAAVIAEAFKQAEEEA